MFEIYLTTTSGESFALKKVTFVGCDGDYLVISNESYNIRFSKNEIDSFTISFEK